MGTGYKVMAYQLKKTASSAKIQTVRVEDRQVDAAGELALWQEEDRNVHRSHRLTGVFHPREETQSRVQHTGIFHPQIVDGVAYIPPSEAVSASQIVEVACLPGQGSAMSLIDEVINTVAKTEAHEVSFVDSPHIEPTKPSMRGVEGLTVDKLGVREGRRWLAAGDTAEDVLTQEDEISLDDKIVHPGSTLTLRSTQRPVLIPEPSAEACSSAQLKAWVGGAMSAIAIPAVQEESRDFRALAVIAPVSDGWVIQNEKNVGDKASQNTDLSASSDTTERNVESVPAVHEPALSEEQPRSQKTPKVSGEDMGLMESSLLTQAGILTPASTIQKLSLFLLSILVIVEGLRLLLGK